jgi:uncharacterized damage-inducible protein DinB
MINNLQFFKECLSNELQATVAIIDSIPPDGLAYKPHYANRTAGEIIEHLICHMVDMRTLIKEFSVDETFSHVFKGPKEASLEMQSVWKEVQGLLADLDENVWEEKESKLFIHGNLFIALPINRMMWFFFFDIIHHRGQLSTYVRPMGGKVPIIYGSSGDFPTF